MSVEIEDAGMAELAEYIDGLEDGEISQLATMTALGANLVLATDNYLARITVEDTDRGYEINVLHIASAPTP